MIHVLIQKFKEMILQALTPADPYVDLSFNKLVVRRYYGDRIETLEPVLNRQQAENVSKSLIQKSSFVSFDNKIYDLRRDGLYRFYKLPDLAIQRVVCQNGIYSLLEMIGYLWIYGNRDDGKIEAQINGQILSRPIYGSCGTLVRVAYDICRSLGIKARIVATISAESWNGQDDGHTLLEIMNEEGEWFVYDPSFHHVFLLNGKPLSLIDLCKHKNKFIEYKKLSGNMGHAEYNINNYAYDFWIEERLYSKEVLAEWYNRILEVPLILINRNYVLPESFVPCEARSRFEHRYSFLSDQDFEKRFYSSGKVL